MTWGEQDSGRSDLDSTGPQRSGSDVESWYGYYTVLLLTLRYVHELSIRRLLFVYYTYTTEGQYKNVGAVVVVIVCTSPSAGFKLTTLEVICTDCTGRCSC
jgi:hypothetical protein